MQLSESCGEPAGSAGTPEAATPPKKGRSRKKILFGAAALVVLLGCLGLGVRSGSPAKRRRSRAPPRLPGIAAFEAHQQNWGNLHGEIATLQGSVKVRQLPWSRTLTFSTTLRFEISQAFCGCKRPSKGESYILLTPMS